MTPQTILAVPWVVLDEPEPVDVCAQMVVTPAPVIIAALVALTCSRPDGDETFITLGGYPVGQCAPSRQTLTGRGDL